MTATVLYQGGLRTQCTHIESGAEIYTDAPKDNQGNGEAFSPTDLVATALGSCMLSIMGIKARQMEISIEGAVVSITKIMAADPRRIKEVKAEITMPANNFSDKDRVVLERAALTCPVALSLHPDISQTISWNWL
ncbi:MAG: OsmC family protein [Chitinophagales bacterium]